MLLVRIGVLTIYAGQISPIFPICIMWEKKKMKKKLPFEEVHHTSLMALALHNCMNNFASTCRVPSKPLAGSLHSRDLQQKTHKNALDAAPCRAKLQQHIYRKGWQKASFGKPLNAGSTGWTSNRCLPEPSPTEDSSHAASPHACKSSPQHGRPLSLW